MGSNESHFNVSVGSYGQSHKTVSTNHNLFWRERRAEAVSNRGPSAYQPSAIPLGQTGSLHAQATGSALYPHSTYLSAGSDQALRAKSGLCAYYYARGVTQSLLTAFVHPARGPSWSCCRNDSVRFPGLWSSCRYYCHITITSDAVVGFVSEPDSNFWLFASFALLILLAFVIKCIVISLSDR